MRSRPLLLAFVIVSACRSDPPVATTRVDAPAHEEPSVAACTPPDVRVVPASGGAPTTTLVLLHGYGASAADMEPVGRALAARVPRLAVIVPDGCDPWEKGGSGRQWFGLAAIDDASRGPRVREAATRIERFLASELPKRGLPTDRVAFAGFSQGAMLSQWFAVHATPRPVAVVSFSGRFDDAGAPDGRVRNAGTPVLLVHGERDAVIPFAESARSERALLEDGERVERVVRPAMGHAIDDASIDAAVAFLAREVGR